MIQEDQPVLPTPAQTPPAMHVTGNVTRPYELPRLRTERSAMESSYDRTGGNDDGFSGKYSFIRKEGDALVIAELKGPGVIQRIWTPTPTDQPLEFYFDGEATPRINVGFRDLFLGRAKGFPEPLVGHGGGGFYSYVPIPYRKSVKVVYRGPVMQFFQINHATLADSADVHSYDPNWQATAPEPAEAAMRLLGNPGAAVADLLARPGSKVETVAAYKKLLPGKRVTLLKRGSGGRIVGMRLGPASALAGKERSILLRISWDGGRKPAVLCPAGDFFGASWGEPAMRSALVGSDGATSYCYLPMPFDKSATVELVDERTEGEPIEVAASFDIASGPRQKDEGRFYAVWRRENPTTLGKPFTFVEALGHGHIVGVSVQAQGMTPGSTPFFEGDDQTTIDGVLCMHGTGSEDFLNGGWYDVPGRWDGRKSFPVSGCLDYKKHMGRSAGFRFMPYDPVVFQKSITMAIEHAPEKNDIATDYVGVAYLYSDKAPAQAGTVAPPAERKVADPVKVTFAAGWNIPIRAFSLNNMQVSKRDERVGDRGVRFLRVDAEGEDVFGQHVLELLCDVPASGDYKVQIEAVAGPNRGTVQVFSDEMATGPLVDLHAATPAVRRADLGRLTMRQGLAPIMLKLAPSGDQKRFGLDLVTIELTRLG